MKHTGIYRLSSGLLSSVQTTEPSPCASVHRKFSMYLTYFLVRVNCACHFRSPPSPFSTFPLAGFFSSSCGSPCSACCPYSLMRSIRLPSENGSSELAMPSVSCQRVSITACSYNCSSEKIGTPYLICRCHFRVPPSPEPLSEQTQPPGLVLLEVHELLAAGVPERRIFEVLGGPVDR